MRKGLDGLGLVREVMMMAELARERELVKKPETEQEDAVQVLEQEPQSLSCGTRQLVPQSHPSRQSWCPVKSAAQSAPSMRDGRQPWP